LASLTDDQLDRLIAIASELVKSCCGGRTLESTAHTEYRNGHGDTEILLDEIPISSLDSVTVIEIDGTEVDLPVANFDYDPETGELWFKENASCDYLLFPHGRRNIKIVYTAGYESEAIPEVIQEATARLMVGILKAQAKNPSLQSWRLGDYQESLRMGDTEHLVTDDIDELLRDYRDQEVA
jgi:hypothetical protein